VSRFGSLPRRLVHLVIVLFGITLVTFFLLRLIPGDPALAILGSSYTHTRAVAIDNFLGLNKPIWTQYGLFMGRLFHGNLGFSFFYDEPATTVIGQHIAPTLFLVVYSAVLAALISFPIGFAAGLHRGGVIDQSSRIFFTLSFAMPGFWLGIILILIFSVHVPIFPISGFGRGLAGHLDRVRDPGGRRGLATVVAVGRDDHAGQRDAPLGRLAEQVVGHTARHGQVQQLAAAEAAPTAPGRGRAVHHQRERPGGAERRHRTVDVPDLDFEAHGPPPPNGYWASLTRASVCCPTQCRFRGCN